MTLLAGCAVFDDQGRVLLIYRNTPDLEQWEMPGGKVEKGEDPRDCSVREIKEELGVEVEVTETLGTQHFEFRDVPYEYHYFKGQIVGGEPKPQEEKHDNCGYIDIQSPDLQFSHGVKGLRKLLDGKA